MGAGSVAKLMVEYKKAKSRFFERNYSFKGFKNIDEERMSEIKNNANLWLENCYKTSFLEISLCLFTNLNNTNYNPNINKYNDRTKNNFFDFTNNDEEVMFFMFVIDSELKLLQIYYEENNLQNIKRRYREEFGVDLDERLLKIELIFNKKFPTIVDEFEQEKILTK